MSASQATLSWAQTAALNPRLPICAGCGKPLTPEPSSRGLRRCGCCRPRAARGRR